MKRLIASSLCAVMAVGCLTACGGNGAAEATNDPNVKTINVWAFTNEVPDMLQKYVDEHPEFGFELNTTIIATTDGLYQPALDAALQAGGAEAPDIYCAEAAFILKYAQGDASGFAAPYKDLGIDVDKAIKDGQIADYSVQIGTNPGGDVVALGYQATGGAFIYRRSVAKDVWGTDDPATVKEKIGGGSGSWDKFWTAAEELKAKGYGIISGDGDLWHAVENSSDTGWVVDGKLNIDPKREEFLDLSKKLKDNGYHNDTQDWQDAWFADMKGEGEKEVLGFFGPAWLINYTIAPNCGGEKVGEGTYGDWSICESPIGFFCGGTCLL
ncbi:MAG: extracellular solute-binding protein, partial [Lachnospiraceae bacterium]|nr:extracellular solute-binding protein [Lachnospiraceae bacterium]